MKVKNTMQVNKSDLEAKLKRVIKLTGNQNLALSSWSNGRRRMYRVVEKDPRTGAERNVSSMAGTSREIYYFLMGVEVAYNETLGLKGD